MSINTEHREFFNSPRESFQKQNQMSSDLGIKSKPPKSIRKTSISKAKQALIEKRLKGSKSQTAAFKIIPQIRNSNNYPLSYGQKRLWFLNQLEPENPVYNRPVALRLRGALKVVVLQHTLDEIWRRHEILRCRLSSDFGQPQQKIGRNQSISPGIVELSKIRLQIRKRKLRLSSKKQHGSRSI